MRVRVYVYVLSKQVFFSLSISVLIDRNKLNGHSIRINLIFSKFLCVRECFEVFRFIFRFTMENVEVTDATKTTPSDEIVAKKLGDNECKVPGGAVDIVDHYAIKCDPKSNECSDSTQPLRPPRKYSDYSSDSMPTSRKASETLETSPMKPSRKLSQCSANRKFSTTSDTASIRTPKKVSFSDELPLAAMQISTLQMDADSQTNEYLHKKLNAIMDGKSLDSIEHSDSDEEDTTEKEDNEEDTTDKDDDTDHLSSPSSSISTQTLNELTKADMFPNSRKVSLHSEREFDMSISESHLKPGTESATTQITTESEIESTPMDTFLESERKMSTSSIKSNHFVQSKQINL